MTYQGRKVLTGDLLVNKGVILGIVRILRDRGDYSLSTRSGSVKKLSVFDISEKEIVLPRGMEIISEEEAQERNLPWE